MSSIPANTAEFCAKINVFRHAGEFADLKIECRGGVFIYCHRLILAATCDSFLGTLRACKNAEALVLPNADFAALKQVLRFLYTGNVDLTPFNVSNTLLVSKAWKISDLENRCVDFLKYGMPLGSALEVWEEANENEKSILMEALSDHIVENLGAYSSSSAFLKIPSETMRIILHRWRVSSTNRNPDEVLTALVLWFKHSSEERRTLLTEHCMTQLRFNYTNSSAAIRSAVKVLGKAPSLDWLEPEMRSTFLHEYQRSLRVFVHCVGEEQEDSLRAFTVFNTDDCLVLGEIHRPYPNQVFRSVALDYYLYCLFYSADGAQGTPLTYPQTFYVCDSIGMGSRKTLKPPPFAVRHPQMCGTRNFVHLHDKERGTVWYNSVVDTWFPMTTVGRTELKGVCMTSCGDTLYLIGANDSNRNCVYAFDCRAPCWRTLRPTGCRYDEGTTCCTLDDKVYVCGDAKLRRRAEVYDPAAGKWRRIKTKNLRLLSPCRMTSYMKRLWAVDAANLKIEVYEPESDQWRVSTLIEDTIKEKNITDTDMFIVEAVVF